MRGYFGIGMEGVSKPLNAGNVLRSAHAFGASFFFTVRPNIDVADMRGSDTSEAFGHVPFYSFDSPAELLLPKGASLVAIELVENSIDLPSFRHPQNAAYVLGPEKGNVSDEMLARCDHVVKIPTVFCINVAMAGAIVMYDRVKCLAPFAERPVREGGPDAARAPRHRHGSPITRSAR